MIEAGFMDVADSKVNQRERGERNPAAAALSFLHWMQRRRGEAPQ